MLIFGITGGSGAGKSTVSEIFRSLGVEVADADKASRQVTERGAPCLEEIRSEFGDAVLNSDGSLNRKKLGEIVFSDSNKLKSLNNITHKYIEQTVLSWLKASNADIGAIDGAVLIGSGIDNHCSFIVSVLADRDVRLNRISKRDTLDYNSAEMRLNSQPDDNFYIENSDYVIYNNGSEAELLTGVKELYEKIKKNEV